MDPLDDVLDGIRVRHCMTGRSMMSPPWALAVDGADPFVLCAMVNGSGWLCREGHDPVPLGQGTIAVTGGARPVVVADHPDTPPSLVITGAETCVDPATGENLADHRRVAPRAWGDPGAPVDVVISGYRAGGERFATLAADLPELIVVADDPVARSALDAVAAETTTDRPGRQAVLDRLVELLLFATVRAWLSAADAHAPSWYRALGDPRVGPALRAIHDDPARRWTVASLAAVTAQSRAAFARRFREVVGEPPLSYLTRWRLASAGDLLTAGATVEEAACAVGYTDPFAFSTAFRRHRGLSPSHHRRRHRG